MQPQTIPLSVLSRLLSDPRVSSFSKTVYVRVLCKDRHEPFSPETIAVELDIDVDAVLDAFAELVKHEYFNLPTRAYAKRKRAMGSKRRVVTTR